MIERPKIYKFKGLKTLICRNDNSFSTSCLVLVKTGTDWERKRINGIAHFLEHLYFKGTKNFPNFRILSENIEKMGGTFNAFTFYEYTGFYIKVLPDYTKDALFILNDIILNPLFPEEEIEKERKVVLEEINMNQDDPKRLILDLGVNLIYGDQPAGWPVLGTKESILNISRKDILNFMKKNYSRKNTLIVVSGKIKNEKEILESIKKYFANYENRKLSKKIKFKKPKNFYQEKIYNKKVEQAHIFIGFPSKGFVDLKDKVFDFSLFSDALGGRASSRLFIKLREELGACYYVFSSFNDFTNRSFLQIRSGLNSQLIKEYIEEIVNELVKIKKGGFNKEELEISKNQFKSSLSFNLEDSYSLGLFYGIRYLFKNKIETPLEIYKKIDSVKEDNLKKIANEIFRFNNTKFVIIAPEGFKASFSKIFEKLD